MSDISIGQAAGEGFSVARRHPLAVLAWGVVPLLLVALYIALMSPLYIAMASEFARAATSGTRPNPMAWTPQAMQSQGFSYLLAAVGAFINAVVTCAVIRSVLWPDQSRFGYMRLGKAELFLALIAIGAGIAIGIGVVVAMIPFVIVIVLLAASHAVAAAVIVGVIGVLALFIVMFYVVLRFSLIAPMIVHDNDFRLMESWAMTKGKVGALFGVGVLVFLIMFVIELVVFGVLAVVGFGILSATNGGIAGLPTLFKQPPGEILTKLAPLIVVYLVVTVPFNGLLIAIRTAPWARVYQQLNPTGDVAKTFA